MLPWTSHGTTMVLVTFLRAQILDFLATEPLYWQYPVFRGFIVATIIVLHKMVLEMSPLQLIYQSRVGEMSLLSFWLELCGTVFQSFLKKKNYSNTNKYDNGKNDKIYFSYFLYLFIFLLGTGLNCIKSTWNVTYFLFAYVKLFTFKMVPKKCFQFL